MKDVDLVARVSAAIESSDLDSLGRCCMGQPGRNLAAWAKNAVYEGKLGALTTIVNSGGLANNEDELEEVLVAAASEGWEAGVSFLLSYGVLNLNRRLPLTHAAASGNVRVVEMLIAAGADPKQSNPGFLNAMDFALRGGHIAVVELLTQHGVEPSGNA